MKTYSTKSHLSVGVLITNYETWELTYQCVKSCLDLDGFELAQLVVVDDCSKTSFTHPFDARVTLVKNPVNIGLVRSLNRGLSFLETDIVVIFDSDARPLKPFVSIIRNAFISDQLLGVLGFHTVDDNGMPTQSFEVEPGVSTILLGQALSAKYSRYFSRLSKQKNKGHLSVYTCAMAVRRSTIMELGGFDEEFDWLDLDHELSMRVNRSRWSLSVHDTLLAYHEGGGAPQKTSHRVYRFYQNRWRLLRKFGKIKHPFAAKCFILGRLRIEELTLTLFGRLIYHDPLIREDKTRGRKRIIELVRAFS